MPRRAWFSYSWTALLLLSLLGGLFLAPKFQESTSVADSLVVSQGLLQSSRIPAQLPDVEGMPLTKWLDRRFEQWAAQLNASIEARIDSKLDAVSAKLRSSSRPAHRKERKKKADLLKSQEFGNTPDETLDNGVDVKSGIVIDEGSRPTIPDVMPASVSLPEPSQEPTLTPASAPALRPRSPPSPSSAFASLPTRSSSLPHPVEVPGTHECKSTSVSQAPKEWCGRKGNKACTTNYEKAYMQKNEEKLAAGLAKIRAPGCFPHGVSVATMGYYRTGSTLLYNVARLWAILGAPTSLVSGWMCKSPREMGIGHWRKEEVTARCSVVCKDHEWHSGVAKESAVVLSSRRDPWESVCSRKLMGIWCRLRQTGRKKQASKEEKEEYTKMCYNNATVQAVDAQMTCKDLMKMQANVYHQRWLFGKEMSYDVLMSDYYKSPETQVREVARAMGICQEAYDDPALVKMVVDMGVALKSGAESEQGITQSHGSHSDSQRQKECSHLREWMREDPVCREWMDSDAAAESNAILREMKADPKEIKKREKFMSA